MMAMMKIMDFRVFGYGRALGIYLYLECTASDSAVLPLLYYR